MSHAASPPNAKNVIANSRAIALVRVSGPRDIFVTSGSSKYIRIAAIATGISIGCRKLMILAPAQITEAKIPIRTTTKNAVRAAHIILRCQGVGYSFISQRHQNVERVRGSYISPGLRRSMFAIRCLMFDVKALVRSGSSLSVSPCLSSFWWFGSCPRDSCFSDRAPALFDRLPMLPGPDSILNKCRQDVRTLPGPRVLRSWQRAAGRPKLDQTDPFEIPPSRGYPDTRHYSVRFPGPV